ncbi:carbohydrate ABC transporter permease [Cellulomonas pakistanensis]|uniref:Sugar ABC transporter permease n=1 Tax=Cellulomonas pakistanensis TaxID=992287 RepID=A0A919U6P9_9CELL|nr:sugar ABC transporter permease [Cellulomonas pakistanensis]GIG36475.1 sugar ABC transporter permease [Cellulomonas pakistanensis]
MAIASSPARPATTRSRPARRGGRDGGGRGDLRAALVFLIPASIGFVVFYLVPAVRGAWFSLTDYSVLAPAEFVGLENYRRLLDDPLFWNAMKVTAYYVLVNIVIQTVVAIALAMLLQRMTRSILVRGMALLPYFVANVVVALVWYFMLDYQIGVVNVLLGKVGVDPQAFFGDPALALPTIALINVWRHMGYTALLLFAGLQTISPQVYEAASLDGASAWRQFRSITLPLLRPVLALVLVVTVTGSFQIFDTVAVTTGGGPVNATRVIYLYIYDLAFAQLDFGYASAMSVVLFAVLLVVALVQLKLTRADESDNA